MQITNLFMLMLVAMEESDGGVFQNCSLSNALGTNSLNIPKPKPLPGGDKPVPFVVVADDAFPL